MSPPDVTSRGTCWWNHVWSWVRNAAWLMKMNLSCKISPKFHIKQSQVKALFLCLRDAHSVRVFATMSHWRLLTTFCSIISAHLSMAPFLLSFPHTHVYPEKHSILCECASENPNAKLTCFQIQFIKIFLFQMFKLI